MNSVKIQNLINYAKMHLGLNDCDELYIRNRLLEATFETEYTENKGSIDVGCLVVADEVVNPIIDELITNEKIKEEQREEYLCKLMDIVSLKPSEIENNFDNIYKINKLEAFKYLHAYSIANNYVKLTDIQKNIRWITDNTKSKLEITINLSKPEKPLSAVKAAFAAKPKYPKCVICLENMGYLGHGIIRQNLRGKRIILGGEEWFWQYSPYAYFNEHGIAINNKHTPMVIDDTTINKLFDFIDYIPDYFIGCNAALPIIGGSILSHDHFQGGRYNLPLFSAKPKYQLKCKYEDIAISILDWYNNVIHLESSNRNHLEAMGNEIIKSWRKYFDIENHIIPFEEKEIFEQHSSLTIITRYKEEKYILDLILRNNLTNSKYPEGIFHAHPEYYNIKEEAIGLIEASGLFVLPPRLKRQLNLISDFLSGKEYNIHDLSIDMLIHKSMIERLLSENSNNNSLDKAKQIVINEVNRICECILDNIAVYKNDENGLKGLKQFLRSVDIKEIDYEK